MTLEELKEKARTAGYTHICLEAEGVPPVSLAQWRGVGDQTWETHQGLPAVVIRQAVYHLVDKKVSAKTSGNRESWYILT